MRTRLVYRTDCAGTRARSWTSLARTCLLRSRRVRGAQAVREALEGVRADLRAAEHDNSTIYLEPVPSMEALPPGVGVAALLPIRPPELEC